MPVIAPFDCDAFVVAAAFIGDKTAFALGDGTVRLVGAGDETIRLHKGALLAACPAPDGRLIVTGGDDGRVLTLDASGEIAEIAEKPRKWIDILAVAPQGAIAYASGRTAWVKQANGTEKEFAISRAIGGIAFAPKGLRLAIARYDGASLYWVNVDAPPQELAWKGAHAAIAFSPDGKYLVTTMQENALHGWRLADQQDMRMTGYPAKVKSMHFSAKGKYLATSGANAAILWPFFGKTGPMGQQPLQLGARSDALVSVVACHPSEDVVAIGYQDGMVLAARFQDGAEVLLKRPGNAPISTLAWHTAGGRLAYGSEEGEAGIITLTD
ncbi:WD40 repeat domain-containing protein [Stappia sp. F7233]|uniref:WD40 repeat domain-containing protein n=1 Tax=Stappia albiluteola TaxID=2758565 RepID=A0A839ACB3_9HYPH|nr:WD40 repeat domain-containing protein [Stappia albiluteola]MBA5777370.1 WD40 repeat domain-containing protein [Stappia albiluteola]